MRCGPAHRVGRSPRYVPVYASMVVGASLAMGGVAPRNDGVYTREQADRGHGLYDAACSACHGAKLEGGSSGPLAGEQFIASWAGPTLTLDDFYYIVRKTMPKDAPASLTPAQYLDVVAYILQQNSFPPGEKELTSDAALMKTVRFGSPASP